MGGISVFMIVTSLIVLFPVLLQLQKRESRLRDVWGYFVFILGLLLIAAGDTTAGQSHQAELTIAGVVASILGLILQGRNTSTSGPRQEV